MVGSYNSQSQGPIELEDLFQAIKRSCYTEGANRNGDTVHAALSLMCLNKSSNLTGRCDKLLQGSITFLRKFQRTFTNLSRRVRPVLMVGLRLLLLEVLGHSFWAHIHAFSV